MDQQTTKSQESSWTRITLKNFEDEVEPNSDSDFEHEIYDDDGQPLVDGDNDPLLPWQDGVDYTEGQVSYLQRSHLTIAKLVKRCSVRALDTTTR